MAAAVVFGGSLARAIVSDFAIVGVMHQPLAVHADQGALNALPDAEAFTEAFELGDELFATAFNAPASSSSSSAIRHTCLRRVRFSGSLRK
jgi:hypothetical protein